MTLRQMQEIARRPLTPAGRAQAAARLACSVAQSMRAEGYPVTEEQAAEACMRILGDV